MVYVYQIVHTGSSMEHREVASFACGDESNGGGSNINLNQDNSHDVNKGVNITGFSVNTNITGRLMIYDYVKTFLLISFKNYVHILNLNDLHTDFDSNTNFKFHEQDKIW